VDAGTAAGGNMLIGSAGTGISVYPNLTTGTWAAGGKRLGYGSLTFQV
jgi:hypothetical protein